jgi:hypothetical protein
VPPACILYSEPNTGPFYVSPSGNDSTGDGSAGNPWATIGKARDFIRTGNLNLVQTADIVVNVASGTYAVSSPIAFAPADSGGNGHNVIYRCSTPGGAIFNGGQTITGWVNYSGSVYRAPVTGNFWTLYENGIRSTSARYPKLVVNNSFPMAQGPYFNAAAHSDSLTVMQYTPTDMDPSPWSLPDLQVVLWPGGLRSWLTDTAPVSARDTTAHTLTLTNQAKFYPYLSGTGSRYLVQGVLDLLTQAGEWYFDRNDVHGSPGGGQHYLYYWARDGAIGSQTIVAPLVTEIFQFIGDSPASPISNITIDGLMGQYTDFVQWYRSGYAYDDDTMTIEGPVPNPHIIDPAYDYFTSLTQARLGMFHVRNAVNLTLTNFHLKNAGMCGVYTEHYVENCTFSNFWIEKTGLHGMRFDGNYPGEGDVNRGHTLTDFKINNFGELGAGASGLEFAQSGHNTVSYFEIHDGRRKGIWIYADTGLSPNTQYIYAGGNYVHHGKVNHVCQDSGDTGAVTTTALSSLVVPYVTNTFEQMIIDSISATPTMPDAVPNGMFTDNETDGQVFTNIQVTNTQGNQFRANGTDATTHTYNNTSFKSDGTPNGSFNPALMDTANIGVTSNFPF